MAIGGGAFLRKIQNGEAHSRAHTHTQCGSRAEEKLGRNLEPRALSVDGEENYVTAVAATAGEVEIEGVGCENFQVSITLFR